MNIRSMMLKSATIGMLIFAGSSAFAQSTSLTTFLQNPNAVLAEFSANPAGLQARVQQLIAEAAQAGQLAEVMQSVVALATAVNAQGGLLITPAQAQALMVAATAAQAALPTEQAAIVNQALQSPAMAPVKVAAAAAPAAVTTPATASTTPGGAVTAGATPPANTQGAAIGGNGASGSGGGGGGVGTTSADAGNTGGSSSGSGSVSGAGGGGVSSPSNTDNNSTISTTTRA